MRYKNKKSTIKKYYALSAVAAIALIILLLELTTVINLFGGGTETSQSPTTGELTADKQEKVNGANDKNTKSLPDSDNAQDKSPAASTSSQKNVNPVITSWKSDNSGVTVDGYVPGVIENGGTCKLTLTKGASEVSVESKGIEDVSTTSCGTLPTVARSKLSAGTWRVVVSYSSSKAKGTSSAVDIVVK